MLFQFVVNGFITGLMYSLGSIGFSLVYNTNRIFHIAYGVLYVIAGYVLFFFSKKYFTFPFSLSLLLSMIFTSFISIAIYLFIYKPLIKSSSPKNVLMISSIGLTIVLTNLIVLFFGNQSHIIQTGIPSVVNFGVFQISDNQLLQILCGCIFIVLYTLILNFTKVGIVIRGIRDDETLLNTLGINSETFQVLVFGFSGFLIALPGCLISNDVGIDPYMGMPFFLNILVCTTIGGMGNFYSPIIGSILLGLIQAVCSYNVETRWINVLTFVILLLFLFIKPTGIIGEKSRNV
jgi:branched-chain amino acid transport system permease protein